MLEVFVRREQVELMPDAKLSNESVDRLDLNTLSSTKVSESRRLDVIVDIRPDDGEKGEIVDDAVAGLWTLEPLEQLLQNESCSYDRFAPMERPLEQTDFRSGRRISPERKRPNARIDENVHHRDRSFL